MNKLGYYSPEEIKKREDFESKWADWRRYQNWQAAMTMNLLFGDGYVDVPTIPKGYEKHAQTWWSNLTH